jgi:hypothetical protein
MEATHKVESAISLAVASIKYAPKKENVLIGMNFSLTILCDGRMRGGVGIMLLVI